MDGRLTSGDASAVRKPGRYGDRFYLKEHKLCPSCGESETRLAARFCCWCGARFSVVVTEGAYKAVQVFTPIGGTTAEQRMLPSPLEEL